MSRYSQTHSERRRAFRPNGSWRAGLVTLTLAIAFAALDVSHLCAEELPEEMVGVWVEGDCTTAEHVRLMNDLGIVQVTPTEAGARVLIMTFERITVVDGGAAVQSTLLNPNTKPIEQRFALKESRLDGKFVKCPRAPLWLTGMFGEAVVGFQAFGDIKGTCGQAQDPRCFEDAVFDYVTSPTTKSGPTVRSCFASGTVRGPSRSCWMQPHP
jgi:hypothetical protein